MRNRALTHKCIESKKKGLICLYKFVVDVIVCCRILSFVRHRRTLSQDEICARRSSLSDRSLPADCRFVADIDESLVLLYFFVPVIFFFVSLPRLSTKLRSSLAKVERLIFDMLDFIDFPRDSDRHFRIARYMTQVRTRVSR